MTGIVYVLSNGSWLLCFVLIMRFFFNCYGLEHLEDVKGFYWQHFHIKTLLSIRALLADCTHATTRKQHTVFR